MKQKPDSWKHLSSSNIAECRVFSVREDVCSREIDGKQSTFFVIDSTNWVNIIALTKNSEVVVIEQFRHGTEQIITEIPGGMVDEGEEPSTTAKRELLEETGFTCDDWVVLGSSQPNPAIQNNTIFHYLARGCEKTADTSFDHHESIVSRLVPLAEVEKLIADGTIMHSLVIAAFYYLSLQRINL
ncbi:MAG: NUDIX hydrolase [Saprospiraceae bacterium]|nr:NUDIX hydrolase [Pyrinomonadaceae bacterium]